MLPWKLRKRPFLDSMTSFEMVFFFAVDMDVGCDFSAEPVSAQAGHSPLAYVLLGRKEAVFPLPAHVPVLILFPCRILVVIGMTRNSIINMVLRQMRLYL